MPLDAVLRAIAPKANATFVRESAKCAPEIMARAGFVTPRAQAELLAELAHESMGFTRFEENLNYSAKRLRQVWPARFPTDTAAQACANNPKALANTVYNGRMGNRKGSNDGYNFRGSGALQHTGRSEYERASKSAGVNLVTVPERLRDPAQAAMMWEAAVSYMVDRRLVGAAQAGLTATVRRGINGGAIGLDDVKILVARAEQAIGGKPLSAPAAKVAATKTTAEKSDDARANAQAATVAVPAAAGATSAATDWSVGPAIGVGLVIAIGAVVLWRFAIKAKEKREVQELASLAQRASF